ncbi:Crp/Fnr family transcriptional regulator [Amycolatopsis sp. lyj-346]|uniref:Crp/Fnr family transcriptional regulator n=1 Tax=Amycolatopsis sp. lyj-346 TaxID=2789289 RepID=UPI003977FA75
MTQWADGTFMNRLSLPAQSALSSRGGWTEYPAGITLLRQGDWDTDVLLLENARSSPRACVKVVVTSEAGDESLLGLRTSGDVIGELASICGAPRTATVTTCTATAVRKFTRGSFDQFLAEWPEAQRELMVMLASRLNWANRCRHEFTQYPVLVRLARMIADVADRFGHATGQGRAVGIQLSQREWGQLIGASEETVRQAMRRLRDHALIENSYRRIVITDVELLRQYEDPA